MYCTQLSHFFKFLSSPNVLLLNLWLLKLIYIWLHSHEFSISSSLSLSCSPFNSYKSMINIFVVIYVKYHLNICTRWEWNYEKRSWINVILNCNTACTTIKRKSTVKLFHSSSAFLLQFRVAISFSFLFSCLPISARENVCDDGSLAVVVRIAESRMEPKTGNKKYFLAMLQKALLYSLLLLLLGTLQWNYFDYW